MAKQIMFHVQTPLYRAIWLFRDAYIHKHCRTISLSEAVRELIREGLASYENPLNEHHIKLDLPYDMVKPDREFTGYEP